MWILIKEIMHESHRSKIFFFPQHDVQPNHTAIDSIHHTPPILLSQNCIGPCNHHWHKPNKNGCAGAHPCGTCVGRPFLLGNGSPVLLIHIDFGFKTNEFTGVHAAGGNCSYRTNIRGIQIHHRVASSGQPYPNIWLLCRRCSFMLSASVWSLKKDERGFKLIPAERKLYFYLSIWPSDRVFTIVF